MRVLVVDDEYDIRRVLRLVLENEGYEVEECADGRESVEKLREDASIDLCIMDIMMPVMTGIEALREIRAFSSVPVLFLTARSFDSDKENNYVSVAPSGNSSSTVK